MGGEQAMAVARRASKHWQRANGKQLVWCQKRTVESCCLGQCRTMNWEQNTGQDVAHCNPSSETMYFCLSHLIVIVYHQEISQTLSSIAYNQIVISSYG